jgi:hypothetical protein
MGVLVGEGIKEGGIMRGLVTTWISAEVYGDAKTGGAVGYGIFNVGAKDI